MKIGIANRKNQIFLKILIVILISYKNYQVTNNVSRETLIKLLIKNYMLK